MKKQSKMDNIALLTIFEVFREPLFWGPIVIIYILEVGKMSLAEVYFMEAVVLGLVVLVEVYSSSWADLLGRKKIIILGSFLNLISLVVFSLADSAYDIWISNIAIMTGFALYSGADQALIADYLKDNNRENEFLAVMSKIRSKRFLVAIFSTIFAGYMYSFNPRLPLLLSIPGMFIALLVLLFIEEPKRKSRATHKENFDLIKISVLFLANHKKLKWIVVYFVLMVVLNKLWFFAYNPYFDLVELDPQYYGWVFSALNLMAFLVTKNANKIKQKMGEFGIILFSSFSMSLPLIFMSVFISKLSISMLLLSNFLRGMIVTLQSEMKNRYLSRENRATVISLGSTLNMTFGMLSLALFGLALNYLTLSQALLELGLISLVLNIYLVAKYRKIFS